MSLDSLCRWQVQVSVYCAWRIPAHLRCTQCSILLHLMDICFLTCICLWQISQIQTFLFKVVGPGLVSTSPAFVSRSLTQSFPLFASQSCWECIWIHSSHLILIAYKWPTESVKEILWQAQTGDNKKKRFC